MVANITSGDNVKGMVAYNTKKVENGEASVLMLNNINDGTQAGIQKMIQYQNNLNPNVKNRNFHVSLNFHKNDLTFLNEKRLKEIAEQYMNEMGYGDQPYAVFQHFDASHPHVHIVSSRIGMDGRKIKDSMERRRSKRITDSIERSYGLIIANDQSTMPGVKDLKKEVLEYVEKGKGDLRNIIDQSLYVAMSKLPLNEKELKQFLNSYNIDFYYDENLHGLTYYLFKEAVKENGEKVKQQAGKSLKASETTKKMLHSDLQAFFERNKNQKSKHLKNVRGTVFSIFNPLQNRNMVVSLNDLTVSLSKKGIGLNVLRAKSGDRKNNIIGVSFTDRKTGFRYTGEEVKLKWTKLSPFVTDDRSDVEAKRAKENTYNPIAHDPAKFEMMTEIEKIMKLHSDRTPNDHQEDLRKKKKKKRML
ncbi:relaxase/mobilization nuclease domain-containing protein [Galbibacter mesophilus]|uniref:relaxase/mobilization nuclease domain-containing protein n=1 Tax=Galbibacter mesophilus TaxID=379069 RepID=UPI00191D2D07|nr:relaxase/mobilization nuclease domain-containing protein [Galbibacter mesophilus]MCM5664275.1 relaxase/mobilization nuclease domain-containing protein [Galbibacter mesophilus]